MITVNELGIKLQTTYNESPRNEQVTYVILFGLKYHKQINVYGVKAVVDVSGIPNGYISELHRAIKLSKYMKIKQGIIK